MPKRDATLRDVAEFLGITERHAYRAVEDGILPGENSRYDLLECARAWIRHQSKDAEGKRARTALAQVEAKRKQLQLRRQLGHLLTPDERLELDERLWTATWSSWQRAAAEFYAQLALLPQVTAQERLRVANLADQSGKAWLIQLRDEWRVQVKDAAAALREPDRINLLLEQLEAGEDERNEDDQ